MNYVKCPITDEDILKVTPRGILRTPLYSEIFYKLTDGSIMRIAVSKNAKKNLKKKNLKELFEKIRKERLNNLKIKDIPKKDKEKYYKAIEEIGYKDVKDKRGISLNK